MTVAATSGRELPIERLVLLAYQSVGLVSIQQGTSGAQWADRLRFGQDMLQIILRSLAAYGVQARSGGFYNLTVTAADVTAKKYKYDLASTVLDVVGNGVWIPTGGDVDRSDNETQIRLMSREEWQRIGNKGAVALVTRMYIHRENDPIQAWLWPIPDAAGTVRLDVQRKLADTNSATATLDVEDYWTEYIVEALGAKLAGAQGLSQDVVGRKQAQATSLLSYARSKSLQRGPKQARLDHWTPWRQR